MTFTRLGTVSPAVVSQIDSLDQEQLRTLALALAEWALSGTRVQDVRVESSLAGLRSGEQAEQRIREEIKEIVNSLDEIAWDLQDGPTGSETLYRRAFCDARAVNAVLYAMHPPSSETVMECAYEAQAARESPRGLEVLVASILEAF